MARAKCVLQNSNWGEPERAPHWSNGVPRDVYLCLFVYMYRTSFRKYPRILIHWTASILLSVIQFRKFHYVQIIETASILHLQWTTSMYMLLTTHDRQCTTTSTAESVNYSYSELSYVSAKLYTIDLDGALYRAPFV